MIELLYLYGFVTALILIISTIFYTRYKPSKFGTNSRIQEKNILSISHQYQTFNTKGFYFCNICGKLVGGVCQPSGKQCVKCGIVKHKFCKATQRKCKFVTNESSSNDVHQWIEGNLDMNSVCAHCNLICGSIMGIEGKKCLWCQKCVHNECENQISAKCDYGTLKGAIITPNEFKIMNRPKFFQRAMQKNQQMQLQKEQQQLQINKIDTSSNTEYYTDNEITQIVQSQTGYEFLFSLSEKKQPIIVVINKKSGGQVGAQFLQSFYQYLNPIQIIDLVEEGLERIKMFANIKDFKILVGGGDGSVASLVNFLKTCNTSNWNIKNPPVGILPLGTGNDLARALGWGGKYSVLDAKDILQKVDQEAKTILLDRWEVTIKKNSGEPQEINKSQIKESEKKYELYNYFSIGLDAQICHKFHHMRLQYPHLFKSQIGNKFIYSQLGTNVMLRNASNKFQEILSLKCDGNIVNYPKVENIIVLNINSWAGGASNLWKRDESRKFVDQSHSDGMIEVIGVTSVLQLGQCQIGMDKPIQICQGRVIEIQIKGDKKQIFQIDGEPMEVDTPVTISFVKKDKAYMLTHGQHANIFKWETKIINTLEWATEHQHISEQQKNILQKKLLE